MQVKLFSLISLLVCKTVRPFDLPEDYESKTATEKQEELWSIIEAEKGTSGRYPGIFQFFKFLCCEDVSPSVEHEEDSLPYNHGKRIHSVGGVAKAKWESVGDHTYTGLFQGETLGMVRLSLAVKPLPSGTTPGMAMKLFRDGIPSANFVAMNSLSGQESGNFFETTFSNHIDFPTNLGLKILATKFERVSSPATMVGLSDIAAFDQQGQPVTETVNFPFQIILVPNEDLTREFEDAGPTDSLEDMLASISSGTKLWDVLALSGPDAFEEVKIAEIKTDSDIIFSIEGDKLLFFHHQKMSEDSALRPDWNIEESTERRLLCPHLRQVME